MKAKVMQQNTKKIFLAVTVAVLLLPQGVMAQGDSSSTQSLAPISVNTHESDEIQRDDLAIDSPTNLYKVESSARAATQVLTQKDIQAYVSENQNIFDLLNNATGIDISYQGRKSPFQTSIRGSGGVTYIIDGAILPSSVSDRILMDIPLSAIEQIEIVRSSTTLSLAPSVDIGASSSNSGSIMSFIIIRTKQPKKTEGIVTAGAQQAINQPIANSESIYLGTRIGDLSSLNGYVGGVASGHNAPTNEYWFNGNTAQTMIANAGLNYEGFSLNFMGYKDKGTFDMQRAVSPTGVLSTAEWFYNPVETTILSVDGNMKWNENQITLFSASRTTYNQTEIDNTFGANNSNVVPKQYAEDAATYSLRHNARFGNTAIGLGYQQTRDKGFGPNLSNSFNSYSTTVSGYSLSVEEDLFNNSVVLDAGYRRDQKKLDYSSTVQANPNANDNSNLSPASIVAVGALWKINNIYSISSRYTVSNAGNSGSFTMEALPKTPQLQPEKQQRWEVDLQASLASYFKPMLAYFDTNIQNQKVATTTATVDNPNNYYYTQQNTHIKGVELSATGAIQKDTSYKFSFTHILSDDIFSQTATTTDYDGTGLTIPTNSIDALISHIWDGYRFNVSAKNISNYSSSNSPAGLATGVNLGNVETYNINVIKDFKLQNYKLSLKLYCNDLNNAIYSTRYVNGYFYNSGRTLGTQLSMAF